MADRVGREGQQLGNYRLLHLLGRGGFADVYLGQHIHLNSHAAVKILRTQLPDKDAQQFIREAQILARFSHPHIVRVLDFALQDGTPFLVMEYAPGGTLRSLHPKASRVPLETVVRYVKEVASALQYAHDQHLVHRDVKPENMLLGSRSEVLLSDFGLAMLAPHTISASTEAMEQPLAGTSPYLAPEQLHGKPRPSSDQYALGVVVYEWLCGAPPFHGSPFEIAMQHLSLPPPPLRERLPKLSPGIEEVVLRALAKEPGQRFASVQDFAAALLRACDEPAAVPVSPTPAAAGPAVHPHPAVPTLHIKLLGDFLLVSGEMPITSVDVPRLQSLLAYLAIHRTAPQPRTHLAYQLLPDSTDAQALTNLRNAVHRLRHTLPNADAFLHVTRQGLQWQAERPDVSWILDVQEFERALAQADEAERAQDLKAARRAFTRAVEVYQGDVLPSCYDEWIIPVRDRLRQAFLQALDRLIGLLEGEREYAAAIGVAQRLLRLDPLHEAAYRQLMRLYAASGDRASALRTYHTCTTVFERELGTEPGRATREAYERLLQKEGELQAQEPEESRVALPGSAQLIGRTHEWGQLQTAWRKASAGQPHVFVLSGEAGIGKTRLAEELLTWVERQGSATAAARCYAAQGELAFAPVATWLRSEALRTTLTSLGEVWLTEVVRLLPDLLEERPALRRPEPLAENWQRKHMLEAFARAMMSTHEPLLLLLDDIQWCDRETLEWLHFLLHFEQQTPLLLIGTMRSEEMEPDHPLLSLLRNLRRDGLLTELALEPLNAEETASLALHLAGQSLDPAAIAHLYQETEGNPLFVVETVRAGALAAGSNGQATHAAAPARAGAHIPPTVQAVIAARLAQLSSPARELVGLAAVIGRAFTFEVLAKASGAGEDTLVQGLDELWQRRIVREQGGAAYDFSHDKLREGAYTGLSAVRRRLLHRRVAETLEMGYGGSLDTVSGQIAAHYERAGLLPKAIPYYRRAGEVAQQVYANQEALAAFLQALAILDALPPEQAPQEWKEETATFLHEQVGDIFALTGRFDPARESYQSALSHVPEHHPIWKARLYRKIGKTALSPMNSEAAFAACNSAESALNNASGEQAKEMWQEWIQVQFDRIWLFHVQARIREYSDLVEKVQPVVETYGTPEQMATFYISVCTRNFRRDRYIISEETLTYAETALKASQQLGNAGMIAQAQFTCAFCRTWHNDLEEGEKQFHAALRMAERIGDALMQAHCLTYLSIVHRRRGRVEETRRFSAQALAKATDVQRPESIGMAKANLAWVAWRLDNVNECQENGLAALELWLPLSISYPFCWTALLPLIGVTLVQQQVSEAVGYARTLLQPHQQRLPDVLTTALETAIHAWDADQPGSARSHLQQATALAREMGYL